MEKKLHIAMLMDLYSGYLTDKQRDAIFQFNELDYSLREIANNLLITHQAVHFAIKSGIESLEACERRLGFIEKFDAIADILRKGLNSEKVSDKNEAIKLTLAILGRE